MLLAARSVGEKGGNPCNRLVSRVYVRFNCPLGPFRVYLPSLPTTTRYSAPNPWAQTQDLDTSATRSYESVYPKSEKRPNPKP